MRYAIVIEKAEGNYSAYVPDLPGCVATGATVEEAEASLREAIAFHLEGMRECGLEAAWAESKTDLDAGRFVKESVEQHIKRLAMLADPQNRRSE